VGVCLVFVSFSLGYDADVAEKGGTMRCPAHFHAWREDVKEDYVSNNPGALHCYCDEYVGDTTGEGCGRYFQALTVARLFRAATAIVLCGAALLVDALLAGGRGWNFEKPESTDVQENSIMWRSFVLKSILYGLLFLFTMGYYNNKGNYRKPRLSFNFTPEWYNGSGQALILTMLLNIFAPHMIRLYQYFKFKLKQRDVEFNGHLVFTQDDMNSLYSGPQFILSQRYSQMLATFFVLYMYLASMPIFALVGLVTFYVTYWVDKFLFIRFYATPIRYPASVGLHATALIPYAVMAHLILSLWAVSQSDVFATSRSETSFGLAVYNNLGLQVFNSAGLRKLITQEHTVYLSLLLLFLTIVIIIKWTVQRSLFAGSRITQLLCFEFVSKYDFFFSTKLFNKKKLSMSFPRAVRRGFIKGLDNYNILQNQRYKDAFHIDEVSANQHRRVRSLLVAQDERPQRGGGPKPLPADDPKELDARALFQLALTSTAAADAGGRGTPRDRRDTGTPRGDRDRSGGVTPRERDRDRDRQAAVERAASGGLTPRERDRQGGLTPRAALERAQSSGMTPRDRQGNGTTRDRDRAAGLLAAGQLAGGGRLGVERVQSSGLTPRDRQGGGLTPRDRDRDREGGRDGGRDRDREGQGTPRGPSGGRRGRADTGEEGGGGRTPRDRDGLPSGHPVSDICYAMYAMLCYVCYAMLCYVVLCYAMYAMLCYAMLCYAMLCIYMCRWSY
jgi:hypothetical protein